VKEGADAMGEDRMTARLQHQLKAQHLLLNSTRSPPNLIASLLA
jgi:hypothetical protein